MRSISDIEFARKIALDLLSIRPRSEVELRQSLKKKNVPGDVVDELCARFTEVGLLDDAAFAASLVTSRSGYSRRGKYRIRQELREKGIDDDVAEEALAAVSDDEELEAAREVAQKKARTLGGLEPHVAERRLAGTLARRGFPPSVVMQVVKETLIS